MSRHPRIAADIMTTDVISVLPTTSIARARELMAEHGIRHLPVVTENGEFVGVVTQKAMLGEVLRIANRFGIHEMEQQTQTPVTGILGTDLETIQPQLPLVDAAKFFLSRRHGCLPVLENGKLVGILTSADFVRLSVTLLTAPASETPA